MDVTRILSELHAELEQIEQEIRRLEQLNFGPTQPGAAIPTRKHFGAETRREPYVN